MHHPVSVNRVRTPLSVFRCRRRPWRHWKQTLICARPLSWDIPKQLFERPERLFPRPERLLGGSTFKDFILSQEEAVREYPWEYVIFLSIVIFIVAEIVAKPYDSDNDGATSDETINEEEIRQTVTAEKEQPVTLERKEMTREQEAILAMKKTEFQAEQNRSLFILGCLTALALWLAGFLNTRHPFGS